MIPAAPQPLPEPAQLVGQIVGGLTGCCCMCRAGCVQWLDLIAAGLVPVNDATGALTDHVALHARCVSTLLDYWASVADHGGPDESTDRNFDGEADVLAGPAAPSLPPMGAYAQG